MPREEIHARAKDVSGRNYRGVGEVERAKLTRGHVVSAFRSMLQPVVTSPSQEQVAGSVKPLLQSQIISWPLNSCGTQHPLSLTQS